MLDTQKIGAFLCRKRKERQMTQQQLADRLHVSFQAVSKWETGAATPNIEFLPLLGKLLAVSVDEILHGEEKRDTGLSYRQAGVDISYTDAMKQEMAEYLKTEDPRVLNGLGPYAALYDVAFPEIAHPVLVLKSEEPGSKQKIAVEYGYTESICHDMINHLVNDIVVMGARPLAVLDTIVCGNAERDTIRALVKGVSAACRANGCALVGGETSIQPQVVEKGLYVLTASIAGIVERDRVVDGSAIRPGDAVLALASNGVHTNGYSLIRMLMEQQPAVKLDRIAGETFIEQIMKPHTAYGAAVRRLLEQVDVHGMAHITGGGIAGNLCRVMPDGCSAQIDLKQLRVPPIFRHIQKKGAVAESEMLSTFNCGAGFLLVVAQADKARAIRCMQPFHACYEIGTIAEGTEKVVLHGHIDW